MGNRTPSEPTQSSSLLKNEGRLVLAALFQEQLKEPRGVSAPHFRARNDQALSDLDDMVATGWIEQRDRLYFVKLVGVAELASTDVEAESVLRLCQRIFGHLRQLYRAIRKRDSRLRSSYRLWKCL